MYTLKDKLRISNSFLFNPAPLILCKQKENCIYILSSKGGSKQHDLLFHFVKDQMLFNGREMTAKKILVSPNDDAKGDRR